MLNRKLQKASGFDIIFQEKKLVGKLPFQKFFFCGRFLSWKHWKLINFKLFPKNWFWGRYFLGKKILWIKTFEKNQFLNQFLYKASVFASRRFEHVRLWANFLQFVEIWIKIRKMWFWDRCFWGKTLCFELKIISTQSKLVRKIAVEKSVSWVNFHLKNVNVGFSMLSWKALFWENNFWEKEQLLNQKFREASDLASFFSKTAELGPTHLSVPHIEPTFQIPSSLHLKIYEGVR